MPNASSAEIEKPIEEEKSNVEPICSVPFPSHFAVIVVFLHMVKWEWRKFYVIFAFESIGRMSNCSSISKFDSYVFGSVS